MILSHKHKFIYIKTMKTASSSIENLLSRHCGPDDVITVARTDLEDMKGVKAQNYRLDHPAVPKRSFVRRLLRRPERYYHATVGYYEHMPAWRVRTYVGEEIWSSYYKFSFERNPWDRQVSFWRYKTRHEFEPRSFETFLSRKNKAFVDNFGLYTIDGKVCLDFVGKFETLDEDLAEVLDRIGLDPASSAPSLNQSAHAKERADNAKSYRTYYSSSTRRLVADWYKPEIELFGYEF